MPTNRLNAYKEAVLTWCEESTAHGLPKLISSKTKPIKFMWLCFFLCSLGYCTYTLVQTFQKFSNNDVDISISVIYKSPVEFPAITICNLDPICDFCNDWQNFQVTNSLIDKYNLTVGIDWSEANSSQADKLTERSFTKLKRIIANTYIDNSTFRRSLGFDLKKQMLLSCYFNKKSCDETDFTYFWSNDYGNCYTFNSGKDENDDSQPILTTSKSGQTFGLQLELLTGNPINFPQYIKTSGIFVIVHNASKLPAKYLTEGFNVATGYETYVSIKKSFYNKQSSPYSNCIDTIKQHKNLNAYSKILNGFMIELNITTYDRDLCYKLCFQDKLIGKCGCGELNIPLVKNTLYCQNSSELDCLDRVTNLFTTSNIDTLCYNACPPECRDVKYDVVTHKASYPTVNYYQDLLNYSYINTSDLISDTPYQILRDSYEYLTDPRGDVRSYEELVDILRLFIVKLNINYNDLTYKVVQEIPSMTVDTLLGILGGQLGLFIGISFLSLVEVLELIMRLIVIYRKEHSTTRIVK